MKAIMVHEVGGPEVLKYEDSPSPIPGPGQALIDIQAIGVNFTDIYTRSGLNPPASLPTLIGREASGTVSAVGEGVTGIKVGDRVAFCGVNGTYAEQIAVSANTLVKMP